MTKDDYIVNLNNYGTTPTDLDYLLISCKIAQGDNGIAADKRSVSGGGYEGQTIDESFYNEHITSPNKPTWSAVNTIMSELKTAYTNGAYIRNRRSEYPDWGAQLDKIYDDGLTKWKSEMVDPVKAKWPKDNSGPV